MGFTAIIVPDCCHFTRWQSACQGWRVFHCTEAKYPLSQYPIEGRRAAEAVPLRSGPSEAPASLRGARNSTAPREQGARRGEHPRLDARSEARGLVRRPAQGPSALTGLIGWCGKGVTTFTGGAVFRNGWGQGTLNSAMLRFTVTHWAYSANTSP